MKISPMRTRYKIGDTVHYWRWGEIKAKVIHIYRGKDMFLGHKEGRDEDRAKYIYAIQYGHLKAEVRASDLRKVK